MPVTCPSCSSITLTQQAVIDACALQWEIKINNCALFEYGVVYLQHSPTAAFTTINPVTQEYDPITYQSYDIIESVYDPSLDTNPIFQVGFIGGGDLYDDLSGASSNGINTPLYLAHNCLQNSYFVQHGTGFYRAEVHLFYSDGTHCIQYSSSVSVTYGGAGLKDITNVTMCGCNTSDSTYGNDAILALNYTSTPTCAVQCQFESCPSFHIYEDKLMYDLPEEILGQSRSVILADVSSVAQSAGGKHKLAGNSCRLYLRGIPSGGTKYITELSYQWPGAYIQNTNTPATSFKIGKWDDATTAWTSNKLLGQTLGTIDRQRHIDITTNLPAAYVNIDLGAGLALMTETACLGLDGMDNNASPPVYLSSIYGGFWGTRAYTAGYCNEKYNYTLILDAEYNGGDAGGNYKGLVIFNLFPPELTDPEILEAANIKNLFMYPERGVMSNSNTGLWHDNGLLTSLGFGASYNFTTELAGDAVSTIYNGHATIYTVTKSSAGFTTATAHTPCAGETNCPPYYHSTDAGAPSTNTGHLKFLDRIEFANGSAALNGAQFPSYPILPGIVKKLRMLDGTLPAGTEGWYHVATSEWNNQIYNTWNVTANADTPVFQGASKQHWAWDLNSIFFDDPYGSYSNDAYNLLGTQSIYSVTTGWGTDKTWKYNWDIDTCDIYLSPYPRAVAPPDGVSEISISDSASLCSFTNNPCTDFGALNYDPYALPITGNLNANTTSASSGENPFAGLGARKELCFFCDSLSGYIETRDGDDGAPNDIQAPFHYVSHSTTPCTYANWGDGAITMTVVLDQFYLHQFPSNPTLDWRYRAQLYKVNDGSNDGWQDPNSYLVMGGTQDMLTTPTVTYSSNTYPVPLLVPPGDYCIKWSINVLTPGVYELEDCWWEYCMTVEATNPAPGKPIFMQMGIAPNQTSFDIKVIDNSRDSVSHFDGSTGGILADGPMEQQGTLAFQAYWEGQCIDASGGIVTPAYPTDTLCLLAGHTWKGFDRIVNVEDVSPIPYGGRTTNFTFNHTYPLANAPFNTGGYYDCQYWRVNYAGPAVTAGWPLQPTDSLWPSEDIDIKVTWQSGWTKTFKLTTGAIGSSDFTNPHMRGWFNLGSNTPCAACLWPKTQEIYNESGPFGYFWPFDQNLPLGSPLMLFTPYASGDSHAHQFCPDPACATPTNSANHFNHVMYEQPFFKVDEMPTTPNPTYPIEMYEGTGAVNLASIANNIHNRRLSFRAHTGRMIGHSMEGSTIANGTPTYHAGMIQGGFTGELTFRIGVANYRKDWADAHPGSVPAVNYDLQGTGNTDYDDILALAKAGTGLPGANTHLAPAIPNVGAADTITESRLTGFTFSDNIIYCKDCPVCLPPEFELGCRIYNVSFQTGNNPAIQGSIASTNQITNASFVQKALNFEDNSPGWNDVQYDNGSCHFCRTSDGKLVADIGSLDPQYTYAFYKTNPPPVVTAPGTPPTVVEGTGSMLQPNFGTYSTGSFDFALNATDTMTAILTTVSPMYVMQMPGSSYLGHADDAASSGEIIITHQFWAQFLALASENMSSFGTDFQAHLVLSKYNVGTGQFNDIETKITTHYANGQPTNIVKFNQVSAGVPLTYGTYRIRVRAIDTNVGWSGQEPISICYMDSYHNFRVRVCPTNFDTTDGVHVSDADHRVVDPSLACTCCPLPVLSILSDTTCSPTRALKATYNCDPSYLVTQIDTELWYIPAGGPNAGVAVNIGPFPILTGAPITSLFTTFATSFTSQMNQYGGSFYVVSTYTGGATCPPLTSPLFNFNPRPDCDCQDPQASNYLQIYPNGNADCVGVIGGTNYSCCTYPTSCAPPTVSIASTNCAIVITASVNCDLGTAPIQVEWEVWDVTATGGNITNSSILATSIVFTAGNIATTMTHTWTENCLLNEISAWALTTVNGGYRIRQTQYFTGGYQLVSDSNLFGVGDANANPNGMNGHYPIICGCMDNIATNYNPLATCDNGSCLYTGCMDGGATEYGPGGFGSTGDGIVANNYNATATVDDGSCTYDPTCETAVATSIWVRPDCTAGWCDPHIEFGFMLCDLDHLGNFVETPTAIVLETSFSTDCGATFTTVTSSTLSNLANNGGGITAGAFGSTGTAGTANTLHLSDIFNAWHTDGLIASPDFFDCEIRWKFKASYTNYPDAYTDEHTFFVLNPHSANPCPYLLSSGLNALAPLDNDAANMNPGPQENCNANALNGLYADPITGWLAHAPSAGAPPVILVAPCGCTDDGNVTVANLWHHSSVTPYNSPFPGVAASNLMPNHANGIDDGSCIYEGCMDPAAQNYNAAYTLDCTGICGTATCCCIYNGCTDPCATNYNPLATLDDGSCIYPNPIISGNQTQTPGCTYLHQIVIANSPAAPNATWGFTSADLTVTHDGVTQTFSGNIATTIPNHLVTSAEMSCLTNTYTYLTQGAGTYVFDFILNYPSGCTETVSYTLVVDSWNVPICDCINCPTCSNYNPNAHCDDGSCLGCTDPTACNYDPGAQIDDGSCYYCGCTDSTAANYNPAATVDDGSCQWWHVWRACGSSDETSFGGSGGPGPVSLADNQVGLSLINPAEVAGQTFRHPWYDNISSQWIAEWCWEYIGKATGNNPAHYPNPLNTTGDPSQWVSTSPNTTYVDCNACLPVPGCIDSQATNYNKDCSGATVVATVDDGCCEYPCCDVPTLAQAAGHVDSCDAEYVMNINCNSPATDNADTITTTLEYFDGAVWQTANTDVHNPAGTDNITSHSVTYHYNCSTDNFGGYGSGTYRIKSVITYSSGYTCTQYSADTVITLDPQGCTDPTANNYTPGAICQCLTCTYDPCCIIVDFSIDSSGGRCNENLTFTFDCDPNATGYTALWQRWQGGAWVTIQTDTGTTTGGGTLVLPNASLHSGSGVSANYQVVFTSTYASSPNCEISTNILTYTNPIIGCMDGGANEYNVTTGFPGDGIPDGLTASDYDPTAECPGTCCIDGCTDPLASNYNINSATGIDVTSLGHAGATCDDGGCVYDCCTMPSVIIDTTLPCAPFISWTYDDSACPATVTSLTATFTHVDLSGITSNGPTQTIANPTNGLAFTIPYATLVPYLDGTWTMTATFVFGGTNIPSCTLTSSVLLNLPIWGCTNPLSPNYNPLATCDDGSCTNPIPGCTDPAAVNYHPTATVDDGTCIFCGSGCTDAVGGPYSNYDAAAICDCDDVWLQEGYCDDGAGNVALAYDPTACSALGGSHTWTVTYNNNVTSGTWNSCCLPCVYGCTDSNFTNYDPNATCPCTELTGPTPCNATTQALTGADCCCTSCIYGCTDNGNQTQAWWDGANNVGYDYATNTGILTYGLVPNVNGAINYNNTATCEDGSCLYSGCIDCGTFWELQNPGCYCNDSSYCAGDGSPATTVGATNYNPLIAADCANILIANISGAPDNTCCTYPTSGCTDATSLNYDPSAQFDDGSCMFCDVNTGNFEDNAGVDQAAWATGTDTQTATTNTSTSDGQLFVSFNLSATGLIMQALSAFQDPNTKFAIELYSVTTNCAPANTGTLIATSPNVVANSNTTIAYNFTNLPYGYYVARLIVLNTAGVTEPTECYIDHCALVKANICNNPSASNYQGGSIPLDLQQPNNTLCVFPGYCACVGSLAVATGPACSNTANINATLSCDPTTDISYDWADAAGNILFSSNSVNIPPGGMIVSTLPITSNGTYTFTYTETSTPYNTCPPTTLTINVNTILNCDCTDPLASNYNAAATHNCIGLPVPDQSAGWNAVPCCLYCIYGCTDPAALNYDPAATCDDGSCIYPGDGCCDPLATNYNSAATNCVPELCEYCN